MLSKDNSLIVKQIVARYPNRVWRLPESQRVAFRLTPEDKEYIESTIKFNSFRFHMHHSQQTTLTYKGYECDAILLPVKRHADLKIIQYGRININNIRVQQVVDMMQLCYVQHTLPEWLLMFAIAVEHILYKRRVKVKELPKIGYPLHTAYTNKYGNNPDIIFGESNKE